MEPSRCAAPRWWPAVSFGSTKRAPTRPKLCSRSFSREMVRDTLSFAPIVANVAAHPVDPDIFKISPTTPVFSALQAKAHLGDAGREISRLATEIHGGIGFTDLLGLHYWFKRIAFNRQLLGAPERCRHQAAVAQEWVS